MKDTTPLLEIRDVSMRFEFVEALKSVNLTIGHQEVVALVGDNGAGKSTLVKIIAGLYQPSTGSLRVRGQETRISDIRNANALGIASVFQDNEFCENLSVAANLFLGKELRTNYGIRDENSMHVRARAVRPPFKSVDRYPVFPWDNDGPSQSQRHCSITPISFCLTSRPIHYPSSKQLRCWNTSNDCAQKGGRSSWYAMTYRTYSPLQIALRYYAKGGSLQSTTPAKPATNRFLRR